MVEYILEGQLVDLDNETEIELLYSINDIRNASSTNTAYSKTITIPGSPNNNIIFDFLYENNLSGGYDPNVKKNVELRVNGFPIIQGVQRVNGFEINNEAITYQVTITGNNTSIFSLIGDELLSTLDLSSYVHTYSKANIISTWEDVIRDGYYYPWENHNDKAWTWEDIQFNTTGYTFFPSFYVSTLIKKIFNEKGYTIDSDFFETDYFKSLYITFTNEFANNDFIHLISLSMDFNVTHPVGIPIYTYTRLSKDYDPLNLCPNMNTEAPADGYWEIHVWGNPKTGAGYTFEDGEVVIRLQDPLEITGQTGLHVYQLPHGGADFDYTFTTPLVKKGWKVYPRPSVYRTPDGLNWSSGIILYWTMKFRSTEFFYDFSSVNPAYTLPTSLTKKDFLTTLIKMFNLYLEVNPNDPSVITIEPYSYYYGRSTNTIDWTYKVDEASRKVKLMTELDFSSYKFTYKSDTDYLNKTYQDITKKIIGEKTINVSTDFISKIQNIELLCSPTCIVKLVDYSLAQWPSSYKGVSVANTDTVDYYGTITNGWNWRLLSQNKLRTNQNIVYDTYDSPYFYTGSHIVNYDGRYMIDSQSLWFNTISDTGYTWDYSHTGLTTLYEGFWEDYINVVINQNSRLLTIDVYLSEEDISNLRFYEKIFIKDTWYLLNKLSYSPTSRIGQAELLVIPATN